MKWKDLSQVTCACLIGVLLLLTVVPMASAETVYFYHNDHTGTPLAMTDMQGNVVWRQDYKPFGEQMGPGGSTVSNTHTYTGHEYDPETGLLYFKHRFYDPVLGRFITPDPAAPNPSNPQSWNRYIYALNNPYKYVDPDGRLTVFVHGTWSKPDEAWSPEFVNRVATDLGESREVRQLAWSGKDTRKARTKGAEGLAGIISGHKFEAGEELNIIGHSHGGNVGIEALPEIEREVDNLILLGTPRRYDYKIGAGEAANVINAYSRGDIIQRFGGRMPWRLGIAGRKRAEPGVQNIPVTGLGIGRGPHSELHTIKAWEQIKGGLK